MKRFLKLICLLLALAMMLAPVTACDSEEKTKDEDEYKDESSGNDASVESTAPESSETESEAPDPLKDLVFGTFAEYPPFAFVGEGNAVIGDYDGIDMAVAKRISDDNKFNPIVKNMDFYELFDALDQGEIDVLISAMTLSSEREEIVDCSIPYYDATQVMVVKTDSDIKSTEDIVDKTVAIIKNTVGEYYVCELGKYVGYNYVTFESANEAVAQVVNGNHSALITDKTIAEKYVRENEDLKIVSDPNAFEVEQFGIAVKKGNTELLEKINKSIEKMIEDGDIEAWALNFLEFYSSM